MNSEEQIVNQLLLEVDGKRRQRIISRAKELVRRTNSLSLDNSCKIHAAVEIAAFELEECVTLEKLAKLAGVTTDQLKNTISAIVKGLKLPITRLELSRFCVAWNCQYLKQYIKVVLDLAGDSPDPDLSLVSAAILVMRALKLSVKQASMLDDACKTKVMVDGAMEAFKRQPKIADQLKWLTENAANIKKTQKSTSVVVDSSKALPTKKRAKAAESFEDQDEDLAAIKRANSAQFLGGICSMLSESMLKREKQLKLYQEWERQLLEKTPELSAEDLKEVKRQKAYVSKNKPGPVRNFLD